LEGEPKMEEGVAGPPRTVPGPVLDPARAIVDEGRESRRGELEATAGGGKPRRLGKVAGGGEG